MGKGDIKTKRGKITNKSYGKLRPQQAEKKIDAVEPKVKRPSKK